MLFKSTIGFIIPFVAVSVFVGACNILGFVNITLQHDTIGYPTLLSYISVLVHVVIEEVIFRFLLYKLVFFISKNNWSSLIIMSTLFGLIHLINSGVSGVAIVSHIIGGGIYTLAFFHDKRLWLPIALHFGWNFSQIFWGFPMSGNIYEGVFTSRIIAHPSLFGSDYGIEGSWISLLLRVIILMVLFTYPFFRIGLKKIFCLSRPRL